MLTLRRIYANLDLTTSFKYLNLFGEKKDRFPPNGNRNVKSITLFRKIFKCITPKIVISLY